MANRTVTPRRTCPENADSPQADGSIKGSTRESMERMAAVALPPKIGLRIATRC